MLSLRPDRSPQLKRRERRLRSALFSCRRLTLLMMIALVRLFRGWCRLTRFFQQNWDRRCGHRGGTTNSGCPDLARTLSRYWCGITFVWRRSRAWPGSRSRCRQASDASRWARSRRGSKNTLVARVPCSVAIRVARLPARGEIIILFRAARLAFEISGVTSTGSGCLGVRRIWVWLKSTDQTDQCRQNEHHRDVVINSKHNRGLTSRA
jgi:hypothetical protein